MMPFINANFKSAVFRWESRNFQILHLRELFILFKNNYFFKRKKVSMELLKFLFKFIH